MAGTEFSTYKDSQPKELFINIINLISEYMDDHFPCFIWEIESMSAGGFDYQNKHNTIGITIYTNACDTEFSVIRFVFDVDANCFKETPDWDIIRDINNSLLTSNQYHTKKHCKFAKCYIALYNEADRKDGNPQCINISNLIYFDGGHHTNFESIFSRFSYEGNGCMELRTVDFDGEEDIWVYKDNSGYRFLGDTE